VLSPSKVDTAKEFESLPLLSTWVAPADTTEALLALGGGKLPLEILVDETGVPAEVIPLAEIADEDLEALTRAAREWRFTPATANGTDAPAWILFGDVSEVKTDENETTEIDTTAGSETDKEPLRQ
jgi:hypothetical protein